MPQAKEKVNEKETGTYDASKIKILGGIEAVRKRPAMYVGSTSKAGLHHLVYEVVDNSVDEALAGYCKTINVIINKGDSVTVKDDGRGIPIDTHKETKRPAAEVVLTTLHAGGKFGGGVYKVSGGLHGVGVSCVNALSSELELEIHRDGKIYTQHFDRGKPKAEKISSSKEAEKNTGTTVTFQPDPEIFTELEFDYDTVKHRLVELAYLNRGLKITLRDDREKKSEDETFEFKGGIVSYVEHLNKGKDALYKPPFHVSQEKSDVIVEVAFQHCKDYYDENIYSFVNCIKTKEGGTHVVGFKSALSKAVNKHVKKMNLAAKMDESFMGEDVREGLTAIVSLRVPNPQFEGQTKTKLGNSEIKGIVESVVDEAFGAYIDDKPGVGRAIIEKALLAWRVRQATRKAQELERKKSALDTAMLPGKLADCSESDASKCEIFLVEGDSAGGSAKSGRDRNFQAILPLRGKILNVEKAPIDKILANEEIRMLITAIGAGVITGLRSNENGREEDNEELTPEQIKEKLRYHRVVVMTDADVDGAHIRTLLLTFFYRFARPLIENGHIYIAQPPLYLVKKAKTQEYIYGEKELEEYLKKIGKDGATLQRYKGLGEMNPEQLWETTMDPSKRKMLQVILEDAEVADEIFTILMGNQVEPRREFIQQYAKKVRWLDI